MASNIEQILFELSVVKEKLDNSRADEFVSAQLIERFKKLTKELQEANSLLNDKSKILKG